MKKNDSKNLCDIAYAFLSHKLMRGELPPGMKLSERTLSEECGVSRIPMHEAIRRLVEEGALFTKPQSGTFVAALTRRELQEIYEVREAIECRQIRTAVPKMSDAERKTFATHAAAQGDIAHRFRDGGAKILSGKDGDSFLAHDFAQHLIILKTAGNRFAEKIVSTACRRNRFFGLHSHQRDLSHIAWTWYYHHQIARAVLANDEKMAEFWMRAHIRRSMKDALSQFDRATPRD